MYSVACQKVYESCYIFQKDPWLENERETTFNRFVLLGFVGKDKVVAVFACTQLERVELLRFCNNLTPGSACAMIRPKLDHKFMGSVSTIPLLNTAEPLVPLKLKTYLACPINVSAPDFSHFNIFTNNGVVKRGRCVPSL